MLPSWQHRTRHEPRGVHLLVEDDMRALALLVCYCEPNNSGAAHDTCLHKHNYLAITADQ